MKKKYKQPTTESNTVKIDRLQKWWNNSQPAAVILQAIFTILLTIITVILMCRSNQIAQKSNSIIEITTERTNKIIQSQRKANIRPILRVTGTRGHYINTNREWVVVQITNIGTGAAKDLNIIVWDNRDGYSKYNFNRFFPPGIYPLQPRALREQIDYY